MPFVIVKLLITGGIWSTVNILDTEIFELPGVSLHVAFQVYVPLDKETEVVLICGVPLVARIPVILVKGEFPSERLI